MNWKMAYMNFRFRRGGLGKTYACTILSMLAAKGYPVATTSFRCGQIQVVGDLEKAEIIFMDRFDMYYKAYDSDFLQTLGKHAIVLLSYKIPWYVDICIDSAWIEFGENGRIEINSIVGKTDKWMIESQKGNQKELGRLCGRD